MANFLKKINNGYPKRKPGTCLLWITHKGNP